MAASAAVSASAAVNAAEIASVLEEARMRLCAAARASEACLSTKPLTDVTATTITMSTATSSSSPICESRAAAMNSFATEKEMETERSEPIPESAATVPDIVMPPPPPPLRTLFSSLPGAAPTLIFSFSQLERANAHARRIFDGPILTRQSNRYLGCQAFLLAIPSGRKQPTMPVNPQLGGPCAGCVYGCAFGNIVGYCSHKNTVFAAITRKIYQVLVPIAASVLSESGSDAQTMCSGIAAYRITRTQQLKMHPGELEKTTHRKQTNPAVVLGLTASILCVYSVLSSDSVTSPAVSRANDILWFARQSMLLRALAVAEHVLETSTPRIAHGVGSAPAFERAAVDAELRAVQRAAQGVKTATALAEQHAMDTAATFALQLSFFAKSAWPANERLGMDTHARMLQKLSSPLFFTADAQNTQLTFQAGAVHPGFVVPLAELSGFASRRATEASESESASTATGSSKRSLSGCSVSSGASSNGSGEDIVKLARLQV